MIFNAWKDLNETKCNAQDPYPLFFDYKRCANPSFYGWTN